MTVGWSIFGAQRRISMKAIGLSEVWRPNWTVTNRGIAPSRVRNQFAKPTKSVVVTVGLLLVLTLARSAPALTCDIHTVDSGGLVKYARRLSSGSWSLETVDSGGVGLLVSIAFGFQQPSAYQLP
jgi:hypothetical protein